MDFQAQKSQKEDLRYLLLSQPSSKLLKMYKPLYTKIYKLLYRNIKESD